MQGLGITPKTSCAETTNTPFPACPALWCGYAFDFGALFSLHILSPFGVAYSVDSVASIVERSVFMDCFQNSSHMADHGPSPFCANILCASQANPNYRTAFWTGCYLQMTLMEIPRCGDIGLEVHPNTDQLIRVEAGQAMVRMGCSREQLDIQCSLGVDHAVFVPAGTWHNVINTGNCPLKLSTVYAPPHHPRGTVHRTKEDAEH